MGAKTKRILFLGALMIGALVIRYAYLQEQASGAAFTHPRLDAQFHDLWAQSIAQGNVFGSEVFFRAPFYPYLLAGITSLLGESAWSPRIVQHLLGILLIPIVFTLARRTTGQRAAVIASFLVAFYPVLVFFEGELLFDSLVTFLFTLFLLCTHHAFVDPSRKAIGMPGIVLGLLCITRPPFLIFIPFTALILFRAPDTAIARRERWGRVLTFCAATLLLILPVTVRNYVVGKDFVLISSQGGVNFYLGNNPHADGYSSSMPGSLGASWENMEADMAVEREEGRTLKPSELSRAWYLKGLDFVVSEPGRSVPLLFRKALLFWDGREIPNNRSYAAARADSGVLRSIPLGFWLVGPPALAFLLLARKRRTIRFLSVSVLLYFSVTIAFFVCDRYRLPVVPVICIFAGGLADHALTAFRERNRKEILRIVLATALFAVLVSGNVLGIDFENPGREELRHAVIDLRAGNIDGALSRFEKAEPRASTLPNFYLNWGIAALDAGKLEEALRFFRRELSMYPLSYSALVNSGIAHYILGGYAEASRLAESAILERPYLPKAYILRARCLLTSGRVDEAHDVLETGRKETKGPFHYGRILLAGIHATRGETESAEFQYRSILEELATPPQPAYAPELEFQSSDDWGESREMLRSRAEYGLARISISRGDLSGAIVQFEHSVNDWPGNADAWADLGITYHHLNQPDRAGDALTRAIDLAPENAGFRIARAKVCYQLRRYNDARSDLAAANRIAPNDSLVVLMLRSLPPPEGSER
jgi:tetratricopeptide (TPR) repeat protein